MTKKVLFVSDLQCGSLYAIWPNNIQVDSGSTHQLNKGQKYLLECWNDMRRRVGKIDALVVNGDVIDGKQRAQEGTEAVTTNLALQTRAARTLLKPLADIAEKTYMVKGTTYHDQEGGIQVEALGEYLNAVQYDDGQFSAWELNLNVDGTVFNVSHEIGVASLYYAQPLDKEGLKSAIKARKKLGVEANVIVRSHIQNFCLVEHTNTHIFTTPGWQLQTPYMVRKTPWMIPDIGAVLVYVDKKKRDKGEDPVYVQKILYDHPRAEVKIYD